MEITLIGGKLDLISSPTDYDWLKGTLKYQNTVELKEYELGHLGLLFPETKDSIEDILKII